ncbi:MAG: fatty acid desaturase [Verrucomicrobiota bacterium]
MSGHSHHEEAAADLRRDPEVKRRLREFLEKDNYTNFLYIGRAWLVVAATLFAAVFFFENREAWGLSAWWNVPVYLLALLSIGASQHQLAGAGHEAVHHTLFKNRKLNELAGDYLCMFPVMTSVYQFRLYHLAHHQFVNDPERDPDFALLKDSGHWLNFPVGKFTFIRMMLRQILLIDLVRYIIVRVRYNTIGSHKSGPYQMKSEKRSRIPERLTVALFFLVILNCAVAQKWGEPWMLIAVPLALWGAFATVLAFLPEGSFEKSRVKPVFHRRFMYMGQTAVFTGMVTVLSYVQATTGFMALRYFSSLWFIAIVTTFPFFLILRQVIQHGNGDRGWLTNTRVFRMNPFVRYAVFPFGMDYHLPHHMYATIPHYRLKAFHEFLMTREKYRESCQLVDNYIIPETESPRNPTVVEVLGPEYAAENDEIHIDDTVLDNWEVEEKDVILRDGRPAEKEAKVEDIDDRPAKAS